MIPFFTILFTPLFGALVDRVGKATLWMIIGAGLVLTSHLIITFAPQGVPMYAYIAIALLGIGYSLVPSAMWPSVPKIIPEKIVMAFNNLSGVTDIRAKSCKIVDDDFSARFSNDGKTYIYIKSGTAKSKILSQANTVGMFRIN